LIIITELNGKKEAQNVWRAPRVDFTKGEIA
jgi:hypothetical protein